MNEREYEDFKISSLQKFSIEYLNKFKYFSQAHSRFFILPKEFDLDGDDSIPNDNNFIMLNYAFDMWCSSANRQGCKLVPVEPTSGMYLSFTKSTLKAKSLGLYYKAHFDYVYKAVIDAAGN